MSVRLEQFDILKGVGIILVMFGHAIPNGFMHNWIYGFHLPLFFFCSGFFFKEKPLVDATVKDIKGLLIPWMTFSLFLVLCSFLLMAFSSGEEPIFNPLDENCWILYYTIWFLIALFIVRFLYRIIAKCRNILYINMFAWGGYFVSILFQESGINIPFFIDSSLAMLIFYHFGSCFNKYRLNAKGISVSVSIVILLFYSLLIAYLKPSIDVKENVFPFYLPVLSMVPIFCLYQICCRVHSKFLLYCGASSLSIMGLHHPIFDVVMFPLMNRLPLPHACEIILMVGLTLLIVLLADKMINKYTPFLLGKF